MLHLRAWTAIAVAAALGAAGAAGADTDRDAGARFETPPLAAVAAMPEARQALVYDERRGEYAVARVGDRLAGDYRVVAVEGDRVVLRAVGDREVFVVLPVAGERGKRGAARLDVRGEPGSGDGLAPLDPYGRAAPIPRVKAPPQSRASAPPRPGRRRRARPARPDVRAVPSPGRAASPDPDARPAPPDPGGDPAAAGEPATPHDGRDSPGAAQADSAGEPAHPYDDREVQRSRAPAGEPAHPHDDREVQKSNAPADEPDSGGAAGASPGGFAAAFDAANRAAENAPSTGARSPRAAGRSPVRRIDRGAFDRALDDFHALERQVRIERASGGGVRIVALSRGSFVHDLGLRRGDVVRQVAGRSLDSVDDAAAIYAHLARAKTFEITIERDGTTRVLRYRFAS